MPGYHALLGMHAFGLEEMGNYAGAEAEEVGLDETDQEPVLVRAAEVGGLPKIRLRGRRGKAPTPF